jgi:tripartite-type tricarboxylate transporter receptor subunit TctC
MNILVSGLGILVLAQPVLFSANAGAQDAKNSSYPEKPIRMVIPQAAGGNTDILGRMIGEHLNRAWGVPVIIDNRGGAGGNIGNEIVAKATPNGYTLLTTSPALVTSPALYKQLNYDPDRDFSPIGIVAVIPQILALHPSVAARTVQELIQLAKARPGSLNSGSPGPGSGPQVATALFVSMTNVNIVQVAYKGTGPALTDLIGGQIQMMFGGLPALMPQIKAGKIRAVGISTSYRSKSLPDLPTIAESGVAGFDTAGWNGLAGPAGLPRHITEKLSVQLVEFKRRPDIQARFLAQGAEPVESSPEDFKRFIRREVAQWKKVLKPEF